MWWARSATAAVAFASTSQSFPVPCTFGNTTAISGRRRQQLPGGHPPLRRPGTQLAARPGFKEFNFSISKNTPITERVNLQIRAEFFNLFNHPNFSNPNLPNFIADAANNGLDCGGPRHRLLPLTATGDVGIGNPFLGGGGPRGVQFAAKITF